MKQPIGVLLLIAVVLLNGCSRPADEPARPRSELEPLVDRAMSRWKQSMGQRQSDWQEKRKAVYRNLLAGKHCDTLVVPFQVADFGFSPSMRSLMTAKLVYALVEAGVDLPDPYLVADAMGDGVRQYGRDDVVAVARKLDASRIVQGYVGHDQHGVMRVVLRVTSRRDANWATYADDPTEEKVIAGIAFTDEHPAIEKFDALLPDVAGFLVGAPISSTRQLVTAAHVTDVQPNPLPDPTTQSDPAREATHLQMLATIAPRSVNRVSERLYEKSLLAIDRMSPDSPDYRALKARAYMHLDMRPAALAVLEQPKTPAEREVVDALNGNLLDIEALRPELTSLPERVFALADTNELRSAYGLFDADTAAEEAAELGAPERWAQLISRRFAEIDPWWSPDYEATKDALDDAFPIAGFSLVDIERAALTLGPNQLNGFAVELAVPRHVDRLRNESPSQFCCSPFSYRAVPRDYLDVLEAMGIANIRDQASKLSLVQGIPKRALELLDGVDSVLRDQPDLALELVTAMRTLGAYADANARAELQTRAMQLAANVVLWEHGQSDVSSDALREGWSAPKGYDIVNLYVNDLPYHDGYLLTVGSTRSGDEVMLTEQQIALRVRYTRSDFKVVPDSVTPLRRQGKSAEADQLQNSLESRFHGAPQWYSWLALNDFEAGRIDAGEKHLREGITALPDHWDFYSTLADSMLKRYAYDEAAKVYGAYPPFKNHGSNAVAVSNHAFEAGSSFYWRGDLSHARPFFELSAGTRTGSGASLFSAEYVALMAPDYEAAAVIARDTANRYGASNAYRDYLSLLYMLGYPDEATRAVDMLMPQLREQHVWEAALVGQRLAEVDDAGIVAWVKENHMRRFSAAGFAAEANAKLYLMRAAVVDRVPSTEMIDALAAIEGRYQFPQVVRQQDGRDVGALGELAIARPMMKGSPDKYWIEVDGPFRTSAEAFRAFGLADYAKAFERFDTARQHGTLTPYEQPYYAFAAAKTGNTETVVAHMAKYPAGQTSFDFLLAKAVIAGIGGDATAAVADLKRAFNVKPPTVNRIMLPSYEFAEVTEQLWRETHADAYRQLALDWVKQYRVIQPWAAWTYAFEAELTTDARERANALQRVAYLDPGSLRLSRLPKTEVAKAVRAAKAHNPFAAPPRKSTGVATAL